MERFYKKPRHGLSEIVQSECVAKGRSLSGKKPFFFLTETIFATSLYGTLKITYEHVEL